MEWQHLGHTITVNEFSGTFNTGMGNFKTLQAAKDANVRLKQAYDAALYLANERERKA